MTSHSTHIDPPTHTPPTHDEESIVREEEDILTGVLDTLSQHQKPRRQNNYTSELVNLRDSLAEARLVEDKASIIEQMMHLNNLALQQKRSLAPPIDTNSPYFGHMTLEGEDGRIRDILIGKGTFIRGDVRIVDWRHAPISRVFYQYREGDDYVMEVDDEESEGEVLKRRTVLIQDKTLERISTPDNVFMRTEDDTWTKHDSSGPSLQGGQGLALRPKVAKKNQRNTRAKRKDKHLPDIASLLDPEQYTLITRPDSGLVAIQGSAGSGKTTVALHRVAYLAFQDPKRFHPGSILVVVYSKALARYISKVLPALGVDGVLVSTLDAWTASARKRLFKSLPQRISDDTPSVVSRFKQHAALMEMLRDELPRLRNAPVLKTWNSLMTDFSWIQKGLQKHAPNAFSKDEIRDIVRWNAHMDMLRTDPDTATSEDEKPSIDQEDSSLLLFMHQLYRGAIPNRRKNPLRYRHLVIDEVQDLAPIDLTVLLKTVPNKHPVTLAGDTAQKIVEGNDFQDWSYVLRTLGKEHVELEPLRISYRSTRSIMEVAHRILGPLAPDTPPHAPRSGPPVELLRFSGHGEAFSFLAERLQDLLDHEPNASLALLTRSPSHADDTYHALRRAHLTKVQRVVDQEFTFLPGIEIAEISQTKGLEFDYVIVLDADSRSFPANDASRRLLHVAVTRAAHLCWLISVGSPSPLIPLDIVHRAL